jgi:hypothetical protein
LFFKESLFHLCHPTKINKDVAGLIRRAGAVTILIHGARQDVFSMKKRLDTSLALTLYIVDLHLHCQQIMVF